MFWCTALKIRYQKSILQINIFNCRIRKEEYWLAKMDWHKRRILIGVSGGWMELLSLLQDWLLPQMLLCKGREKVFELSPESFWPMCQHSRPLHRPQRRRPYVDCPWSWPLFPSTKSLTLPPPRSALLPATLYKSFAPWLPSSPSPMHWLPPILFGVKLTHHLFVLPYSPPIMGSPPGNRTCSQFPWVMQAKNSLMNLADLFVLMLREQPLSQSHWQPQ